MTTAYESSQPDANPAPGGREPLHFETDEQRHDREIQEHLDSAQKVANEMGDSLEKILDAKQRVARVQYARRLAYRGSSTVFGGGRKKLAHARNEYEVATDAKIQYETQDARSDERRREAALERLLGVASPRENTRRKDGTFRKNVEGEADKLTVEIARQRLIRAGVLHENGKPKDEKKLGLFTKLARKWGEWSEEGVWGWGAKLSVGVAAGIVAGAAAVTFGAAALPTTAVGAVAGATRVSKAYAAVRLQGRSQEIKRAEADSQDMLSDIRYTFGYEKRARRAQGAAADIGRMASAKAKVTTVLAGGRSYYDKDPMERAEIRQAHKEPSARVLTEHFTGWADHQRKRNLGRAAVAGVSVLGFGFLGQQLAEAVTGTVGAVSEGPKSGDAPEPRGPEDTMPTPEEEPDIQPEDGADQEDDGGEPGDTTNGEAPPPEGAIELTVGGGQYVSEVFADAEGSFQENWTDMLDAAAAAEKDGVLRVVYPEAGNNDLFWYEVKGSGGKWVSDTETVVRVLTEYSGGKYTVSG